VKQVSGVGIFLCTRRALVKTLLAQVKMESGELTTLFSTESALMTSNWTSSWASPHTQTRESEMPAEKGSISAGSRIE